MSYEKSAAPANTAKLKVPIGRIRDHRRADSLFRTLNGDFLLREQFITAPSQLLADYLGGAKLTEEAAEASDQLIYAVFSDEALLKSLRDKLSGPELAGAGGDDHEGLADTLADAIAETGARHAVTALMRASVERQDVLSRSGALALLLKSLGGRGGIALTESSGGTMMTTGHTTGTMVSTAHIIAQTEASGGTMMTTGHSTGTMVSTAHRIAHTEMSTGHTTGTEMSTGHLVAHTEMSTGHTTGTEMSTGHLVAHTEMSTGHTTGTEMSTGHLVAHTEMSTGHTTGTDMSTGHVFGDIFAQGPLRATLVALADYSLALKRRGALDSVFVR